MHGYVTTDSSSSDTDDGERELVQRQFFPPVAPAGFTFVQHQKSKLLHCQGWKFESACMW